MAALLFGALQAGGSAMQTNAQVSIEIITVVQALIVIFVAAPRLVKEIFRLRATKIETTAGPQATPPSPDPFHTTTVGGQA
jgi:simple sugar transport system permease protein